VSGGMRGPHASHHKITLDLSSFFNYFAPPVVPQWCRKRPVQSCDRQHTQYINIYIYGIWKKKRTERGKETAAAAGVELKCVDE
jgi:hypothetical protein